MLYPDTPDSREVAMIALLSVQQAVSAAYRGAPRKPDGVTDDRSPLGEVQLEDEAEIQCPANKVRWKILKFEIHENDL